jgi:hypothetical protein
MAERMDQGPIETVVEPTPVVETPTTDSAVTETTAEPKVEETAPSTEPKAPETPSKVLTQEEVNKIVARETRKLEQKHREDIAYWRGRTEGTIPSTQAPPVTQPIPQVPIQSDYTFPQQLQVELAQVDTAFNEGRFKGSYEDYMTSRNLIAMKYSYNQMIQQQEGQRRAMAAKQELDKNIESLEDTNPGAKEAIDKLDKSPYATNRNIAMAVLGGKEIGAKIGIFLGNNLHEARRIASLENEWEQVQELNKLADKLRPQSTQTISQAPKAPTPVNAKATPSKAPASSSEMTLEQQIEEEVTRMSAGRRGRAR